VKDYYQTLGVDRTSSDEDIKRAYRRLASQHHPDKGGDKERFQEIQEAYSVLSDPGQRHLYDNPGIRINRGPGSAFDFNSIFDMFGARFPDHHRARPTARIQLFVGLRDIVKGGHRPISVATPQGQGNIEIEIPQGIDDGDSVRYPGLAPGGVDLIVTFRVRPESGWQRHGSDIIQDITVGIWDLILGSEITVRTLRDTEIQLKIPANTQPGTSLRIRGHGLKHRQGSTQGDMLIKVHAVLPDHISDELRTIIQKERGH
jgi:curved DNA-binding protein